MLSHFLGQSHLVYYMQDPWCLDAYGCFTLLGWGLRLILSNHDWLGLLILLAMCYHCLAGLTWGCDIIHIRGTFVRWDKHLRLKLQRMIWLLILHYLAWYLLSQGLILGWKNVFTGLLFGSRLIDRLILVGILDFQASYKGVSTIKAASCVGW